jgi:general secretion pathway protein G
MNKNRMRRTRRRGFTLMELLVVLAILGLLIAMVAPRILGTQKKADISGTKNQIGMLKAALERYALDLKDFPTTEEGLQALVEMPGEEEMADRWDGPYLNSPSLPQDPWGNPYQYEYPPQRGQGDYPDIWSFGPDGEDGTEDDVVSWVVSADGTEL